jgi:hypothetical protein
MDAFLQSLKAKADWVKKCWQKYYLANKKQLYIPIAAFYYRGLALSFSQPRTIDDAMDGSKHQREIKQAGIGIVCFSQTMMNKGYHGQ